MIRKHAGKLLLFFLAMGMFVALWSLKNHYVSHGSSACNINVTFNCDLVNKGIYSEILGFPVAGIGVAGFLIMGLTAFLQRKDDDPLLAKVLFFTALGGLAFSLYLTYLEAFVIHAWCLLCLASLSAITGTVATSWMVRTPPTRTPPTPS